MTEQQVLELLRRDIKTAGGQRAWARKKGFSASYVNDVLLKRRPPAENICNALGITRLVVYQINYVRSQTI